MMTNKLANSESIYLSVIIPARNSYKLTCECLASVRYTFESINDVEFILIDDHSDVESQIVPIFLEFRESMPSQIVKIASFQERQHYTGVFSYGLTQASGDFIFFLSNDMMLTPSFIEAVMRVAEQESEIGIVRGTSEYTDSLPQYSYQPPFPLRNYQDILDFSAYVANYYGDSYAIDDILSGDAILIKREVVEQIGYLDTQFFGYFGDVDYGFRAQKSGFKLACAQGAWLHHEAAGHLKHEALLREAEFSVVYEERMKLVKAAYGKFREKWNPALPDEFPFKAEQLQSITQQPVEVETYCPAPIFPPQILTIL